MNSISLKQYLSEMVCGLAYTNSDLCYPVDIWDSIFKDSLLDLIEIPQISGKLIDIIVSDDCVVIKNEDITIILNDEIYKKIKIFERSKKIDKLLSDGR